MRAWMDQKWLAANFPDYKPSRKDRIIGKVQRGRWSPDRAERVAEKLKVGPLAGCPDAAGFNPMAEPTWTLPMVVAWMVWRTPDAVRETWDHYLVQCWEWESTGTGSNLRTRDEASLASVRALFDKAPKQHAVVKLMTVGDAIDDLWRRAAEGELIVIAIQKGKDEPVQIPRYEWPYLERTADVLLCSGSDWSDGALGSGDALRYFTQREPQYRDMTFQRDEICRLWPAVQSKSLSNLRKKPSEKDVRKEATNLVKANPNASTRVADELAKRLGADRELMRKEVKAARQKKGNPVKLGRPPKNNPPNK